MRLYSYIAQNEGISCTIVHSLDGYDEISLTSPFKVNTNGSERIYLPEDIGMSQAEQKDLWGGHTIEEAAKIFDNVLDGKATPAQENCVIANSAFAIKTLEPDLPLSVAEEEARESIKQGKAKEAFIKFCEINK